jgi:hypothetical protein
MREFREMTHPELFYHRLMAKSDAHQRAVSGPVQSDAGKSFFDRFLLCMGNPKGIALWKNPVEIVWFRDSGLGIFDDPSRCPESWGYCVTQDFLISKKLLVFEGTIDELRECFLQSSKHRMLSETFENKRFELKCMTEELNTLTNKVASLRKKVKSLEKKTWDLSNLRSDLYPVPERPKVRVTTADRELIPELSGCYFAWEDSTVRYVGQAVNLRKRLRPSHHAVESNHWLSWVSLPLEELDFAEAFYIGVLRPTKNIAKPVIPRSNA